MRSAVISILNGIWVVLLKFIDSLSESLRLRLRPFVIGLLKICVFFPERFIFPFRILAARMLPWDPLKSNEEIPMSIFILATRKDLETLPYSIVSILKNISSTESTITIVSPQDCASDVVALLGKIDQENYVKVKTDESLIAQFGLLREHFPNGHSLMQILKFLCVLSGDLPTSIVLDGDTIFLRRRIWATQNRSVLVVPPEYQQSHVKFVRDRFPIISHSGLGFTTQAQVMRKSWVEEMFMSLGGFDFVLSSFTDSMSQNISNSNSKEFPCEWQVFGDWLMSFKHDAVEIGSYLNISGVRHEYTTSHSALSLEFLNKWVTDLGNRIPSIASLSLHAYKSEL